MKGVNWTLSRSCDCSGTNLTLTVRQSGKVLEARVLDGQILLDPHSHPSRFLVIQPTLAWDCQARYPHGRPGRWTVEYTPEGYRWK